jgi:acetoin utilization protein AcuB
MLVKSWMSQPVITVDADDSMQTAIKRLQENHIRMLPVIANGQLVGVVSDRDLKRASASDANTLEGHELVYLLSKIKIKEIMTRNPITVPPECTLEQTARILLENKISGAPVVGDQGLVVGIITRDDLLKVMVNLTGVDKRGVQFTLQVADRPQSVTAIVDTIENYGGRIVSLLTSCEKAPKGYRHVYLRAYQINRQNLSLLQSELKEIAMLLHIVDHGKDAKA